MTAARRPDNEAARLERLKALEILDSPSEQSFDDITALAAHVCQTPVALITLLDGERQWFKSKVGMVACETDRSIAFCAHAILQKELFVVPDARADERFFDNPLVVGAPGIRFYAGSALISADGIALGTLCVIDYVARTLDAAQADSLRALARQVVRLLEMRELIRDGMQQKRLLRDVIDTIPHVVFWKDRNSNYLGCNQAFAASAGLGSPADVVGKSDFDLPWTRAESEFYRECDQRSMSQGKPLLDIEETLLKADGSPTHLLTSKLPLRDAGGKVTGLLGIYSDVTARRLAEDRFRTVFQSAAIGIALKDAEDRILTPNRAFQLMLGYGEELEGMVFADVTHPHDREESRQLFQSLMKGERSSLQIDKRYVSKSGQVIWATLTLSRLQNLGSTGPVRSRSSKTLLSESERSWR